MLQTIRTKFFRRPFPANLSALKSCRISYSQYGEDLFLTSLLGYEKTDGVFIDIGCYHPIELSNTYIFSQRGWTGVAIDPNPRWAEAWRKFRPKDHFVNAAVSSTEGQSLYLRNSRYPAMNRLIDALPAEGLSPDESTTTVPTLRLDGIAARLLPGRAIDLMNIDCEGHDLAVLQSIDFDTMRPRVIAVEDLTLQDGSSVSTFLLSRGYACRAVIGITKIFEAE